LAANAAYTFMGGDDMPRKPSRKKHRKNPQTERRLNYLKTGAGHNMTDYGARPGPLERLWRRHGAPITRDHAKTSPCTRPAGWWLTDAPEDYRRIVAGVGYGEFGPTPPGSSPWEHIQWFEKIDAAGVQVESEAAYLLRHGLLTPAEIRYLYDHPELLKPVVIMPFDPGYPYNWRPCTCRGSSALPVKKGHRIATCDRCGEFFYQAEVAR